MEVSDQYAKILDKIHFSIRNEIIRSEFNCMTDLGIKPEAAKKKLGEKVYSMPNGQKYKLSAKRIEQIIYSQKETQ